MMIPAWRATIAIVAVASIVAVQDIPVIGTVPSLLAEFEDWFRSPDRGKRDEKTVKQHFSVVFIAESY